MFGGLEQCIHGMIANQGTDTTLRASGVCLLTSSNVTQTTHVCFSAEEGEGAPEGAGEGGAGEGGSLQQWPSFHLAHSLLHHTVLLLQPKHHGQGGTQLPW